MSYILEALRKAERERSLGQAPGLADVAQAPVAAAEQQQRPWLPLVLGALTLLLASALLWSLLRTPPVPTPVAQPVVATPQTGSTAAPPAPAATPAVEDSDSLATLDDLVPATAEPVPSMPQQASAAVAIPPPAATAPVVAQPLAEPARATIELPPEPPAAETAQVETLQLDPSPIAGHKKLAEMPASYRAEFPQLVVDVHASNADPRKRFVLINGRRYKETEALAEGPVIVEIPDGGIVFDYRGERVLVPLSR